MCGSDETRLAPQVLAQLQRSADMFPAAVADHHLHIQSDNVSALLQRKARSAPQEFSAISAALLNTRTGADALNALDQAGIKKGVLLSEAYMFASPFALNENIDVANLTRCENDYNVNAALGSNGRLKAFVGVNPLFDGAAEEIAYWRVRNGVSGIKLHLGNSGFKPQLPEHIAKLARFFDMAREEGLPLIVHVRHDYDYTRADIASLIENVLPSAGDVPVQIAHAGGHGGLDEITLTALACYADAIERDAPGTRGLFFDIAAVGNAASVTEDVGKPLLQSLAQLMRRIGLSRFVMGSDWPSVCMPREHNLMQQTQFLLSREEWSILLNNQAPYLI